MRDKEFSFYRFLAIAILPLLFSCGNTSHPPGSDMASSLEQLQHKTASNIEQQLAYALAHEGGMDDSVMLSNSALVSQAYTGNKFESYWRQQKEWKPVADSLLRLVTDAKLYGLFPEDYHFTILDSLNKKIQADTAAKSARKDAALWAKADLLLTDAFFEMVKHLKLGRLPNDSISQRKDSVLTDSFYLDKLKEVIQGGVLYPTITSLEPKHKEYHQLKAGIKKFLDSADYRTFTKVPSSKEPGFKKALQRRLYESGFIAYDSVQADSMQLVAAVKQYQKYKGITVDGVVGEGTIRSLNSTDADRFMSIAITLDRFKHLPEKMPEKYIWVNLPSFYMKVQDRDSVKFVSKIVCGKTMTRTPVLTSAVSEIITYPQWTVPASIIEKEILPAVKRDPGYLAKKGFSLVDAKGEVVDPQQVDWSKYKRGIPYKVVQGSGDANALGVLKFNFPNKYAVYLHDTNQRYLFGVPVRTLSHGCVRVQEWQKLAQYIIRNDRSEVNGRIAVLDSMNSWLSRKEKRSIAIRNRLPVYIRYFTCEGGKDGIIFHDDIYGEDKELANRFYRNYTAVLVPYKLRKKPFQNDEY